VATIVTLEQIVGLLEEVDAPKEMERAFVAYSNGEVQVPPVGELLFPNVNGEAHIKYGAVHGSEHFLVKVATGFPNNTKCGLPPFGGCMLLFNQHTGQLDAVLLEEGALTNVRTAAAGAVAAKYLAPSIVTRIGICGTGVHSRLQAGFLRDVTACRDLVVWGRDQHKATAAARDIGALGFETSVASSIREVARTCNLIVTTTAACEPILRDADVNAGTHITAMGSDTKEKIELEPMLVRRADIVVVDSISQSLERGEAYHAFRDMQSGFSRLIEIGSVISDPSKGRLNDTQITIADLTGVAVQDIMIAEAIYRQFLTMHQ
jgi:ornithine cyclodeaminase